GEHPLAAEWARRSERRFRRRGNHAWAGLAALMRLRAELAVLLAGPPDGERCVAFARRAGRLARRLRDVRLPQDAEMADLPAGLDTAFGHGRPATVFAWSERSRAQAFRVRPVHPPADPATAEALGDLRQLRQLIRTAELDGQKVPGARARCAELERVLRERA